MVSVSAKWFTTSSGLLLTNGLPLPLGVHHVPEEGGNEDADDKYVACECHQHELHYSESVRRAGPTKEELDHTAEHFDNVVEQRANHGEGILDEGECGADHTAEDLDDGAEEVGESLEDGCHIVALAR